jgi:hypothetical protein
LLMPVAQWQSAALLAGRRFDSVQAFCGRTFDEAIRAAKCEPSGRTNAPKVLVRVQAGLRPRGVMAAHRPAECKLVADDMLWEHVALVRFQPFRLDYGGVEGNAKIANIRGSLWFEATTR